MNDIQAIIKDIDKLQPMPQVANKILSIVEDPNSTLSDRYGVWVLPRHRDR